MGGERGDAGFSATSKSGSTSLFNIGWLEAVLEVGANGKGDKPVMTWRTVVVLGAAAITIEDKRARDTPATSQEIVVFLCNIISPRYLISSLSSPTGLSHANVPSRRRRKVRLIPPRANPPGSGFSNTNFSLLPCPENPENTANGSGKILESDSARLADRRTDLEVEAAAVAVIARLLDFLDQLRRQAVNRTRHFLPPFLPTLGGKTVPDRFGCVKTLSRFS